MIVVDTSVLIAILKQEPEGETLLELIDSADHVVIGTPTFFEYLMVSTGSLGAEQESDARALLDELGVEIIAWTREHADFAMAAFVRFGKGRHSASLNFGDCMAYALAKALDAPLLFKGNDFAATDVKRVPAANG